MGDIVEMKQKRGRGRQEAIVPAHIAPARIRAASMLVNPESTSDKRIVLEVPAWLKDLIQKSTPEGASIKTTILHALSEIGYPITREELKDLLEDDE